MRIFNALQLATINVSSPIWLNLLYTAQFPLHTVAFYLGIIVALVVFIWSVVGYVSSMES